MTTISLSKLRELEASEKAITKAGDKDEALQVAAGSLPYIEWLTLEARRLRASGRRVEVYTAGSRALLAEAGHE